ncbi:hypothetical protein [Natrinema salifodinae]|uniref:Small CPxCG-related zinc finger protein n=1 Tax=Natrinema salifodinae TaxID=1202768 RepID=A0A1I0LWN2_9EURY|nr:hypothetical protein [Natrinema salifodinae]SEV79746.1 hypothetical protein SAMN05216285_0018 [Natrinema salifodinae]
MNIRQRSTSFSNRLREHVRSTLLEPTDARWDGPGDDQTADAEPEQEATASGNLFHCARCSVVYIAAEKQTCPECDGDVEQVRSTLACNQD